MLHIIKKAEPMLIISMFTIAIELITLRALLYESICKETYSSCSFLRDNSQTDSVTRLKRSIVQEKASKFMAIYGFLTTLIPLLNAPYFGLEADRGNFLKCWLLAILFYSFGIFIYVIIVIFNLKTEYFYLAAVVKSLFGGELVLMMTCFTYITKTANPETISWRIIVADTLISVSFILGTVSGSFIYDKFSYTISLLVILSMCFISFIYPIFFLSDLPSQEPVPRLSCREKLRSMAVLLHQSNPNRKLLFGCLTLFVLIFFTFEGFYIISYLYVSGDPFLMSNVDYSYLTVANGVGSSLSGALGSYLINRNYIKLRSMSFMVSVFAAAGYLVFGLAGNRLMIYTGGILFSCFTINLANGKTILISLVPSNENGRLFALIFMMRSISSLAINPFFLFVYSVTLKIFPGIIFCGLGGTAALIGLAFLHPSLGKSSEMVNY